MGIADDARTPNQETCLHLLPNTSRQWEDSEALVDVALVPDRPSGLALVIQVVFSVATLELALMAPDRP